MEKKPAEVVYLKPEEMRKHLARPRKPVSVEQARRECQMGVAMGKTGPAPVSEQASATETKVEAMEAETGAESNAEDQQSREALIASIREETRRAHEWLDQQDLRVPGFVRE